MFIIQFIRGFCMALVFRVYPEAQLHFYLDFTISLSIQLMIC